MNYSDIQNKNWSLRSQDHTITVTDYDDDNDVQLGNNTFYTRNILKTEEEDDEEQEQGDNDDEQEPTLKAGNTYKTAKQTMLERKLLQADARAHEFRLVYSNQLKFDLFLKNNYLVKRLNHKHYKLLNLDN